MSEPFGFGSFYETQAYESEDWALDGGPDWGPERHTSFDPRFKYDPLYYHMKLYDTEVKEETDREYLLSVRGLPDTIWVPKKICREVKKEEKTLYIHKNTFKAILKDQGYLKGK